MSEAAKIPHFRVAFSLIIDRSLIPLNPTGRSITLLC